MADYSGSFFGSFQGTISGSLLGSGILSGSTQIAALGVGIVSGSTQIAALGVGIVSQSAQLTTEFDTRYLNTSGDGVISQSAQVDFNSIVNKPTTIQPFQANSIISNNQFRQVTYPAISASVSTRFTTAEANVTTLQGQIEAAVSGTVPPGTISGSPQIAELGYLTSASAAAAGFGSGGDVTALNLFTGSAQTSLTALNSATSSYLTSANTGSFILVSQTSSMSVLSSLTASFISDVFISASAVRSGFGSGGGGTIQVSGSTPLGFQFDKSFNKLQFDSSTGLNVSESVEGTAFISIGSHFSDIIVDGQPTLFATGSQSLEIIAGNGIKIFTFPALTGANTSSIQELEFRLDTASQHFINAVNNISAGIFALTGSFYSTTNNIQITGSLSVGSGSFKSFEVNSDGFVVLGDMNKDLNNAPIGTIAYSASSFYLIS